MHTPIELGLFPPKQRRFDLRTQEERDDDRIESINLRMAELLAGEFNPALDENIDEALDNLTPEQKEIRTTLVKQQSVNAAPIFKTWVRQYWELRAEQQATEEINVLR